MPVAPFVVLGLPRSRTFWLSRFLTYRDWSCGHEELRHLRSLDDARLWLSQECVGTCETAASPWWRLLLKYRPDVRIVIVRRPVAEVVDSLLSIDMGSAGSFERDSLTALMKGLDAKLAQIERRLPAALTIRFEDLRSEQICAAIFEHCLPYKHDAQRWRALSKRNMQCSMPTLLRYMAAFAGPLEKLRSMAKQATLTEFAKRPVTTSDGLTIAQEPFELFLRDGVSLFAEHSLSVGEPANSYLSKNIALMRTLEANGSLKVTVARSNGRMFGYLMTVIAPSLEATNLTTAIHTAFYASPEFPGLGMKLQRAALTGLRESNIGELFLRAGPRGSGPRMASLYRRLGAEDDGQMFRLALRGA